jgi:ABC-type transport system involved in multi-copper enzyme maturation permease subunit
MFARLVQKELMDHLLDFRFLAVFVLCVSLSALSAYVGSRNYTRNLGEYNQTAASQREALQAFVANGDLWSLGRLDGGYRWSRLPEPLSAVVFGLSGQLGREVPIQYQRPPRFEASAFETDPIHALFGVLDLAFLVKVVLSLCALLFTYDAICGEKEDGTLRLYASFPVARSTLALAKLAGSTLSVLIPFLVAFLLSVLILLVYLGLPLGAEAWLRMGLLLVVFILYLTVFAAFGLWASALTHRRMTAFLGLMSLWALWVFVIPDAAVRVARRLVPVESFVAISKRGESLRVEIAKEKRADFQAYMKQHPPDRTRTPLPQNWSSMSGEERQAFQRRAWEAIPAEERRAIQEAQQKAIQEAQEAVDRKWAGVYDERLARLQEDRRNRMREQTGLAMALSAISPFSAATYTSLDLARTGMLQQEQLENAVSLYFSYFGKYIEEKNRETAGRWAVKGADLSDFVPFAYQNTEPLSACLSRNAIHILNLALLTVAGFAGAYVAILRYDVR